MQEIKKIITVIKYILKCKDIGDRIKMIISYCKISKLYY